MQMPEDGVDDSLGKKRRVILEINREMARFYHNYMMSDEGKAGLNYFKARGLNKKTITKFGLGYAPNSWDRLLKHLKEKGFSILLFKNNYANKNWEKPNFYNLFSSISYYQCFSI